MLNPQLLSVTYPLSYKQADAFMNNVHKYNWNESIIECANMCVCSGTLLVPQ